MQKIVTFGTSQFSKLFRLKTVLKNNLIFIYLNNSKIDNKLFWEYQYFPTNWKHFKTRKKFFIFLFVCLRS